MVVKVFKSEIVGVDPWCVEFPGGAVISTRTEESANKIALAYLLTNPPVLDADNAAHEMANDSEARDDSIKNISVNRLNDGAEFARIENINDIIDERFFLDRLELDRQPWWELD
jgi:hypothetical protein